MSADTPNAGRKSSHSSLAGMGIPLVLVLAAGAVFVVFYFLNPKTPPVDPAKLLNGYVLSADKFGTLAGEYTDADGDLVADTPADAKEPAELFFTEIAGPNPDADEKTWAAFLAHMSQATGKPCKYLKRVEGAVLAADPADLAGAPADAGAVNSFNAQLGAMKAGKLHVTAFSTGQVRQAVNTAGFRPLVAPADKDGRYFYQVKVLVPANSPAKSLADLKGKRLAVSALSSNSGAKAPLVMLHDEGKLNLRTDVAITLTGRPEAAVAQVVAGKADATFVASDLLARELARGEPSDDEKKLGRVKLTEDKFRVIHTSGDYPKLCFGVSHALPRPLADKIKKGFEGFKFDGTAVGEKYKADEVVRFQPVDYKKDWQAVRAVDDRLVEILKAK